MSRHTAAAAAVRVAAVLGVVAAARASLTVRRQLSQMSVRAQSVPAKVQSVPQIRSEHVGADLTPTAHAGQAGLDKTAPSPPPQGDRAAEGSADRSRSRSFVRRGLTATVVVLLAIGVGTGAYAFHLRPDNAIPRVNNLFQINLDFRLTQPARSPIKVVLTLHVDTAWPSTLCISVMSPDLTHPGFLFQALVPPVVQAETVPSDPHTVLISRAGGGQDWLRAMPGAVRTGTFSACLAWDNSGPVQVQGANLTAEFPRILAGDFGDLSGGEAGYLYTPLPISLSQQLALDDNYAYLAGQPPDHQDGSAWSWGPVTLDGSGQLAPFVTIEARNAAEDEQAQDEEFQSGILFGVAAAALIAAIQEFVNAGRKREGDRQARRVRRFHVGPWRLRRDPKNNVTSWRPIWRRPRVAAVAGAGPDVPGHICSVPGSRKETIKGRGISPTPRDSPATRHDRTLKNTGQPRHGPPSQEH